MIGPDINIIRLRERTKDVRGEEVHKAEPKKLHACHYREYEDLRILNGHYETIPCT